MSLTSTIPFTKMQGAGNDFVVIDNRDNIITLDQTIELAPSICNRRFGVGADGIILLDKASDSSLDYTMTYRNADGSDAGMCGNGARCLALFAHNHGLGSSLNFNVHQNTYHAEVLGEEQIKLRFPMQTSIKEISNITDGIIYQCHPGTEHIVLEVSKELLDIEEELYKRGQNLRSHTLFQPKGTNVNFIHGQDDSSLQLQTYERGVEDLTLACGTGAIAAALVWHHIQHAASGEHTFSVNVKGGQLKISFFYQNNDQTYRNISLMGPANITFTGTYHV